MPFILMPASWAYSHFLLIVMATSAAANTTMMITSAIITV